MKKFRGFITLEVEIKATTLEGAKQNLDNAIDFSKFTSKEITVIGYDESVRPSTEISSTGVIKG